MKEFVGHIYITRHARDRFIERRLNLTSNSGHTNVYSKMLGMIKRSTLIKCLRKEDGRLHEYREYAGCIFVCHREYSKDFFKPDLVTIITVEVTNRAIKEALNKGYSVDLLNLNTYKLKKVSEVFV